MLAASRGTLYDSAWARVHASPGDQAELSAVLDRAVDPGDYVAVDMCQHTDASPDCALTVPERLLSDACEGLQAGVAVDPVVPAEAPEVPLDSECVLVNGLRLDRSAIGSFSVLPVEPGGGDTAALAEPGLTTAEAARPRGEAVPGRALAGEPPAGPRDGLLRPRPLRPQHRQERRDGLRRRLRRHRAAQWQRRAGRAGPAPVLVRAAERRQNV